MRRKRQAWAALPADVLRRIAEARNCWGVPQLQLQDTLRAEVRQQPQAWGHIHFHSDSHGMLHLAVCLPGLARRPTGARVSGTVRHAGDHRIRQHSGRPAQGAELCALGSSPAAGGRRSAVVGGAPDEEMFAALSSALRALLSKKVRVAWGRLGLAGSLGLTSQVSGLCWGCCKALCCCAAMKERCQSCEPASQAAAAAPRACTPAGLHSKAEV